MTESLVPVAGSLSARIIRRCTQHDQCPLECPAREVEDLGEVASFDHRPLINKLKEALQWRPSSRT